MIVGAGDMEDLYGVGSFLRKTAKGAYKYSGAKATVGLAKRVPTAVNAVPGLAFSAGNLVTAPHRFLFNTGFGLTKGIASGAGKLGGSILGAPVGILKALGGGVAKGFKGSSGTGGGGGAERPPLTPSPETQAAAAAVAQQGGYSTTGASGGGSSYAGGGDGGGGGVAPSSSELTADQGGEATPSAPQSLMEKFAAMSPFAKIALIGGVGAIGYFGFKAFKKRRGGRRSKR